jgi:hypothetical protein
VTLRKQNEKISKWVEGSHRNGRRGGNQIERNRGRISNEEIEGKRWKEGSDSRKRGTESQASNDGRTEGIKGGPQIEDITCRNDREGNPKKGSKQTGK